jgi:beta-glucosidase
MSFSGPPAPVRAAFASVLLLGFYSACSNRPDAIIIEGYETQGPGTGGARPSSGGSTGTGLTGAGGSNPSSGGTGNAATGGSSNPPGSGGAANGPSTGGTGNPPASGGANASGSGGTSAAGGSGGMVMTDHPSCVDYPEQNNRKQVIQVNHPDEVARFSQMTQAEKIAIMTSSTCSSYDCFDADGVSRLEIPNFRMNDGPRGVFSTTVPSEKTTTFAVSMARAASFDLNLEYRVGVVLANELRALRRDIMLAPTVNTLRHPAWARSQETYGEDPVLTGEMGAAFVLGVQQDGAGMPACPKHYVGNDTDENRGGGNTPGAVNAIIDEQTLRENYTLPFQISVEKSDPGCIMASYNKVNGPLATENPHILTDILRTDWGWKGFTVSDWWATGDGPGTGHGPDALNAGLDLEMPNNEAFAGIGSAETTRIDEASKRILDVRATFGQLTSAYNATHTMASDTNIVNTGTVDGIPHADIARETAEKGAVLLKNDGILPLAKKIGELGTEAVTSIIVMGPDAEKPNPDTSRRGGNAHGLGDRGSSNNAPPYTVSYLAGITARATGISVTSSNEPADAAGKSVVIIPVTMGHEDEGEAFGGGTDRDNLGLSGPHPSHWSTKPAQFINQVAAVNPNVIVLLAVGSAIVDTEDWMSKARGIVQPFYPGQEGGTAVARLLFGDLNFSAKLPFTVGTDERNEGGQYGTFGNTAASVTFEYLHGYRRFEAMGVTPAFWFGYGLSYTTYAYSDVQVLCPGGVSQAGRLNAQVTVTNTGMMAGDEVVQLYVSYPPNTTRTHAPPPKELKAFTRVRLEPGESKQVQLSVPARELRHWGSGGWEFDPGVHKVLIGPSADPQKLLSADFTLN